MLWLARCGLTDLDGVGSFLALKVGLGCPGLGRRCQALPWLSPLLSQELYVSYNNISDLSPLCLLEELEVLDLEGNSVDDLGQVRYLQLCPRLATLTLEGNLVCLRPGPSPSSKVCVPGTPAAYAQYGEAPCAPPHGPRGLSAHLHPVTCSPSAHSLLSLENFWARTRPHRAPHRAPQGPAHTRHAPQPIRHPHEVHARDT